MSKRITRAQLRGEPLYWFCNRAKTTTHEYGQHDNRVFCHGFIDCITAEPGSPLQIEFLTPNEHRALHGLPPIGRKNGKSLGPHTLMEVDVNELMKEEKDV